MRSIIMYLKFPFLSTPCVTCCFCSVPPQAMLLQTGIATASSTHRSARLLSFTSRETNTCSDRSISGLICQSCELVASCLIINGQWQTVPVELCDTNNGFYCNLARKGCSNETGPCLPSGFEGNFACTSQGVFPDPYDCQRYHMCYNAKSTIVSANIECGTDRAFSATTGDCSKSINDTVCTRPQYTCLSSGDSGHWPGNRNIFYICKAGTYQDQRILYPTLYRCAPGEVFNGRDCVEVGSIAQPLIDGSFSLTPAFTCTSSGLYPDPANCRSYFYCDVLLRMKRLSCPKGTHFEDARKSCFRGEC